MSVSIGLDFDEPIVSWFDTVHKASVSAGIANGITPKTWRPYEEYGCTAEEWVATHDAALEEIYSVEFKPGVVQEIRGMYASGYEIHIITARGSFGGSPAVRRKIKELTRSSIIRAGLPYTSLTFNLDKAAVCLRKRLDYFLDDSGRNFNAVAQTPTNVFLYDERWNQDHPEDWHPTGRRVNSVQEYLRIIREHVGLTNGHVSFDLRRKAGIT